LFFQGSQNLLHSGFGGVGVCRGKEGSHFIARCFLQENFQEISALSIKDE